MKASTKYLSIDHSSNQRSLSASFPLERSRRSPRILLLLSLPPLYLSMPAFSLPSFLVDGAVCRSSSQPACLPVQLLGGCRPLHGSRESFPTGGGGGRHQIIQIRSVSLVVGGEDGAPNPPLVEFLNTLGGRLGSDGSRIKWSCSTPWTPCTIYMLV